MAPKNNRKNTFDIKDLIQDGGVKGRNASKSKVGYFEWLLKRGGWKRVGAVLGGLSLFGYVVSEIKDTEKRNHYLEAKILILLYMVVTCECRAK